MKAVKGVTSFAMNKKNVFFFFQISFFSFFKKFFSILSISIFLIF